MICRWHSRHVSPDSDSSSWASHRKPTGLNVNSGFGMFIRAPRSCLLPSRIPDQPTTKKKGKELVVLPSFCSHKFQIIKNYFLFQQAQNILFSHFTKNWSIFNPKICYYALLGIWTWNRDPRSGKNLSWIPDPGVNKAPHPGSVPYPQHWWKDRKKILINLLFCIECLFF